MKSARERATCATLLAAFFVLVAGCRAGGLRPSSVRSTEPAMEKREEPALGVRLLSPAGWQRTDASVGVGKAVVFSRSASDLGTRISVLVVPTSAVPEGLKTREAGTMRTAAGATYRRARLEPTTVIHQPGSIWEYYTGPLGRVNRTVEYGLEVGNKFYVFQFTAPEGSWAALEAPFNRALASLALVDAVKPPNEHEAMVAMRDGVRLYTYVVLPRSTTGPASPMPALLIRSPYYTQYFDHALETFRPFTEQGYALVYQSVRGTGKSEGQLRPMSQEFADGQDAVRWVTKQVWSSGAVGTFGSSYDGFTALAAAVDTPEVKLVLSDGAPVRAFDTWPATKDGAVFGQLLWWDRAARGLRASQEDPEYRRTITNFRPVRDLDLAAFGKSDPIWRATLGFMEKRSAYWDEWSLTDKLSRICAPVISMEAKNESNSDALDAFLSLSATACNDQVRAAHRFVLHSGGHGEAIYTPFAPTPAGELIRSYMSKYLKGQPVAVDSSPIHYFIQNAGEWRTADRWPVRGKTSTYYLDARASPLVPRPDDAARIGQLTLARPSDERSTGYTFDPAVDDACDPKLSPERLAFVSPKLSSSLDLVGRAELVLFVKIDTPDADIFADLLDGSGNPLGQGVGMRLRFRKSMAAPEPMHPDEIAEVHFQFNAAAFRFAAGSSILVAVRSTRCGLSENPNTGGSMTEETKTRPVKVEVFTGPAHPSRLSVPAL